LSPEYFARIFYRKGIDELHNIAIAAVRRNIVPDFRNLVNGNIGRDIAHTIELTFLYPNAAAFFSCSAFIKNGITRREASKNSRALFTASLWGAVSGKLVRSRLMLPSSSVVP